MTKRKDGKPRANGRVSAEEFARIWQKASSLEEVIKETGWAYTSASAYASRLRNLFGVPLKRFKVLKVDWKKVRAAAKKAERGAK